MRLTDLHYKSILHRLEAQVLRLSEEDSATTAKLQFFSAKKEAVSRLLTYDVEPGELAKTYQKLLHLDVQYANGRYRLTGSKTSRDSTGSYFTPPDLAKEITRHAVDRLIQARLGIQNFSRNRQTPSKLGEVSELLQSIRVADLSCGGGDFLVAMVEYVREFTNITEFDAQNLWGVDVDPLALEIARAETSRSAGGTMPTLLLGNPLLEIETPTSAATKESLFALGRIYAPEMGLAPGELPPGGFDLILGNPPWEKIRFEEKKTKALLGNSPSAVEYFQLLLDDYQNARKRVSQNSRITYHPKGEANTYALFAVLGVEMLRPHGVASLILKSAVATSPANSDLFSWLRNVGNLREIHLFENTGRLFPVDQRERFCIAIAVRDTPTDLEITFGNTGSLDFSVASRVSLTETDLWSLYPATGTLPNVQNVAELSFLRDIADRLPRFSETFPDARFGRLVHLTTHRHHILRTNDPDSIPILEGKFIGPYTIRASTFEGIDVERRYTPKARARELAYSDRQHREVEARYFIRRQAWEAISRRYKDGYMLAWRSLTSPTNFRTTIAAIAPFGPAIQSVQFLQLEDPMSLKYLVGLFNSMAFDHIVRLMIPGIDLTQTIIRQVPVPSPADLDASVHFAGVQDTLISHILRRVDALLGSEVDTAILVREAGNVDYRVPEQEQLALRAELDTLFFMAYGIEGNELQRIVASFRPV